MIAVVDYRAGNLTSVGNALDSLGCEFSITQSPADILEAERIVFPGVGAAGDAMKNLDDLGLIEPLRRAVARGVPFLGICLGYQILFDYSAENDVACLGIFPGRVVRFSDSMPDPRTARPLKVPQMGWNTVRFLFDHPVWSGLPDGAEFYFVHAYYPVPGPGIAAGITDYGVDFTSACVRANVIGCQFHPEKSGRPGLRFLDNFCHWTP
jgi:glutamine amidotransferase